MLRACGARKRDQRLVFKVFSWNFQRNTAPRPRRFAPWALRAVGASRRERPKSALRATLGAKKGPKIAILAIFGYFKRLVFKKFQNFEANGAERDRRCAPSDATHRIGFNPALRAGLEAKNGQKMTKMAKNGYFWLFSTASFFKISKFEASARWAVLRTVSAS